MKRTTRQQLNHQRKFAIAITGLFVPGMPMPCAQPLKPCASASEPGEARTNSRVATNTQAAFAAGLAARYETPHVVRRAVNIACIFS